MIDLNTFTKIIHAIKGHAFLVKDFSKFLEGKNLEKTKYYIDIGDSAVKSLIEVLHGEFNISKCINKDLDILTWWIYRSCDKKVCLPNGKIRDINNIIDFYTYLLSL